MHALIQQPLELVASNWNWRIHLVSLPAGLREHAAEQVLPERLEDFDGGNVDAQAIAAAIARTEPERDVVQTATERLARAAAALGDIVELPTAVIAAIQVGAAAFVVARARSEQKRVAPILDELVRRLRLTPHQRALATYTVVACAHQLVRPGLIGHLARAACRIVHPKLKVAYGDYLADLRGRGESLPATVGERHHLVRTENHQALSDMAFVDELVAKLRGTDIHQLDAAGQPTFTEQLGWKGPIAAHYRRLYALYMLDYDALEELGYTATEDGEIVPMVWGAPSRDAAARPAEATGASLLARGLAWITRLAGSRRFRRHGSRTPPRRLWLTACGRVLGGFAEPVPKPFGSWRPPFCGDT